MAKSLFGKSISVSAASLLAALASVAATFAIAAAFDLSGLTDAYLTAILLPRIFNEVFRTSVAEVLIPAISRMRTSNTGDADHGKDRELVFVNNLFAASVLFGAALYAIVLLIAPFMVKIMAPRFDVETARLASDLLRLCWMGSAVAFPTMVISSFLNTRDILAAPVAAEAVRGVLVVFAVAAFGKTWGIHAAGIAFCAGSALQLLYLYIRTYPYGLRLTLRPRFSDPELRRLLRDLMYPVGGKGIRYSSRIVENALASLLPRGVLSAFRVAQQIVGLVQGVTLRGVSIATHPIVSMHAAEQAVDKLNDAVLKGLKLTAVLGGSLFAFIVAMNWDGIAILSLSGAFSSANATLVSQLLTLMVFVLPVSGLVPVLISLHFALGDPKTPSFYRVGLFCLHLVLQFALFKPFGVTGIALAQVFTTVISVTGLFIIMPKPSKPVWRAIRSSFFRILLVSVGTGLTFLWLQGVLAASWTSPDFQTHMLRIVVLGTGIALCLVAAYCVFLPDEIRAAIERFRTKPGKAG